MLLLIEDELDQPLVYFFVEFVVVFNEIAFGSNILEGLVKDATHLTENLWHETFFK